MDEKRLTPECSQAASAQAPIRQWRVGTISMGLSLIALGLVLVLGRFTDSYAATKLFKFWPLILIVLGLEMVLFNALTAIKGGKIRFTYDVLSIFLVLLLLLVSAGLVAMESTGMLNLAQRALGVSERYIEAEKMLFSVDDSLNTLVLDIQEGASKLRTYDGDEVLVSIVYRGYFASQDEARQYAEEQLVSSQKAGDTLLVQVYSPSRGYLPQPDVRQEVTVLVPANLDVELNQPRGEINLNLAQFRGNWVIKHGDSHQDLNVVLEEISDAKVLVELGSSGKLRGNVDWDSIEEQESMLKAEKNWGAGSYTLLIQQSRGKVEINTR